MQTNSYSSYVGTKTPWRDGPVGLSTTHLVMSPLEFMQRLAARVPRPRLPRMGLHRIEGAWTLLYHVPTLLLAGAFMLQEMPRIEIPPWPRRSAAPDWHAAPPPARRGMGGSRTPV